MKLWQTPTSLDALIEKFTAWDDPSIDMIFLPYDIQASIAHVKMLEKIEVLSSEEVGKIILGLHEIENLLEKWEFMIDPSLEDGHTAIEVYLTTHYGEVGKKLHTGRSRNDQSLTMIRLYQKDILLNAKKKIDTLIQALEKRIEDDSLPMPGYTHAQKAMPTTTRTWLESFAHALWDQILLFDPLMHIIDQSPLGSASGFGITWFPNDRAYSAKVLDFNKVQENPQYCWLSRWLFDHDILSVLGNFLMILSRLNNDILLFTTSEFGFMKLPENMTTGSSIMPQKRNYDVCELVRAKISLFFGYADQMRNIYTHLMSGYQRDLQMTKSILVNAYSAWSDVIEVYTHIIRALEFHKENLEQSITPDLLLTDEVYKLVNAGMPFRDAYHQVKSHYFHV